MAEDSEKDEEFIVRDRRRISPDTAEPRKEDPPKNQVNRAPASDTKAKEQEPETETATGPPPKITFSSFVLSLATQAMVFVGAMPNPQDGKPYEDLPAAQHMIDILGMLKEKTTGNLDQSEERLLEHTLYDLRMKYVEKVKGKPL